jgi:hypothetical protein
MIERGSYKGKPTLSLKKDKDDKFLFIFGETKARLILAHIEDIRQFVKDCANTTKE